MSAGREHPRTVLIAGAPWQKTAWPSPHGRSRGLGTGRAHVRSRRQHRPAGLGAGMCVLVRSGRRPAPRCPPIPRYKVTFSEECDASSRRSWKRRKSPRPPSNDASAWRSPERRAGPPHVFVPTRPSKRTPRRSRPAHESAPAQSIQTLATPGPGSPPDRYARSPTTGMTRPTRPRAHAAMPLWRQATRAGAAATG